MFKNSIPVSHRKWPLFITQARWLMLSVVRITVLRRAVWETFTDLYVKAAVGVVTLCTEVASGVEMTTVCVCVCAGIELRDRGQQAFFL